MNINHLEFKLQFIKNAETGKYIPTVVLYDLETNKVIGAKSFEQEVDAEIYKRRAQKKLVGDDAGYDDIVGGFETDKWFSGADNNNISQKETLTELANVLEDLIGSVSVYLRKD